MKNMPQSDAMTVGKFNPKRLERAMHAKGYTSADVAYEMRRVSGNRLKTTERQIYKWLAGDHEPSDVVVLARVLDVTSESLYEADGEDDEEAALLRDIEQLPLDLRRRIERALGRRTAEVGR